MADKQIKKIREAVLANRGGLQKATDGQIMIIWSHLPADIQKQYLDLIKAEDGRQKADSRREAKDAVSDKTKSDL